jgi:hypothetical protein
MAAASPLVAATLQLHLPSVELHVHEAHSEASDRVKQGHRARLACSPQLSTCTDEATNTMRNILSRSSIHTNFTAKGGCV